MIHGRLEQVGQQSGKTRIQGGEAHDRHFQVLYADQSLFLEHVQLSPVLGLVQLHVTGQDRPEDLEDEDTKNGDGVCGLRISGQAVVEDETCHGAVGSSPYQVILVHDGALDESHAAFNQGGFHDFNQLYG